MTMLSEKIADFIKDVAKERATENNEATARHLWELTDNEFIPLDTLTSPYYCIADNGVAMEDTISKNLEEMKVNFKNFAKIVDGVKTDWTKSFYLTESKRWSIDEVNCIDLLKKFSERFFGNYPSEIFEGFEIKGCELKPCKTYFFLTRKSAEEYLYNNEHNFKHSNIRAVCADYTGEGDLSKFLDLITKKEVGGLVADTIFLDDEEIITDIKERVVNVLKSEFSEIYWTIEDIELC